MDENQDISLFAFWNQIDPCSVIDRYLDVSIPKHSYPMKIQLSGAGFAAVNGLYNRQPLTVVPRGFAATCDKMGWPSRATWERLASTASPHWFLSEKNDSYIYLHTDMQWWIDGPDGAGIYIADAKSSKPEEPPTTGWKPLVANVTPLPVVEILHSATSPEL